MSKKISYIIISLLLALLLLNIGSNSTARAADSRFFPETGKTVSGKFLEYWQANGGLPVFGYPITDAQNEIDPETGKTFLTQWFERNRFELHPENAGTRYEVLLGLLGKDLQRDALQYDPAFQPAQPKTGATFFRETGHNLEGAFLYYWQANGGLERFGYPISEARAEGSYETGKMLWTQWFERARFEYHSENNAPYDVLLGLLGNQIKAKPPLKSGSVSLVWQKKADPTILYGSSVKRVDAQGNIALINRQASGREQLRDRAQHFNAQGQLTFDVGTAQGESTTITDYAVDTTETNYLLIPMVTSSSRSLIRLYDGQAKLISQWEINDLDSARLLAVDGAGNIYVASYWKLKKYDRQGNLLATLVDYPDNQFNQLIDGLATDSKSNLYVSTRNQTNGQTQYQLQRFDNQGDLNARWLLNRVNIPNARFPYISVDTQGNVFVATDNSNSVLVKLSPEGVVQSTQNSSNDGSFGTIRGLVTDPQGNIYLSTADRNYLTELDSSGKFLKRLLEPAVAAFKSVGNLVLLGDNLYFVDPYLGKLFRFDTNGQFIKQITPADNSGIKGLVTNGQNLYLWQPQAIARYDKNGQPAGQLNNFSLNSTTTDVAIDGQEKVYQIIGNIRGGYLFEREILAGAHGLKLDNSGNPYFIGTSNVGTNDYFLGLFNTPYIRKYKSNPVELVGQWGKDGSGDGEFRSAVLAFDSQDNLYLLDSTVGRIQKFDKAGKLLAKWTSSLLQSGTDLQVDGQGNVYISSNGDLLKLRLQN